MPHNRQRISGPSGFQEGSPQFIKFFLRQITDVAMQLLQNIANKCFCHLLKLLRLELEVTKASEMAATIDQLTN
jgi:hypothetical protein